MNTIKFSLTIMALAITTFAAGMEQQPSAIPSLKVLAARPIHRKLDDDLKNSRSIEWFKKVHPPQDILNYVKNSEDEMAVSLKLFWANYKNEQIIETRKYLLDSGMPWHTIEKQHPLVTTEQIELKNWESDGHELLLSALATKRGDIAKLLYYVGMPQSEFSKSLYKLFERHYGDRHSLIQTFLNFKLIPLKDKYDNWPILCKALKLSHSGPKDCTALTKSLLVHGCDANAREDLSGETALMLASQKDCAPCVRELIKSGAKIEATDDSGKTAVIHATIGDNVDAFRVLVEHKANTDVRHKDLSLFDYAKEQQKQKILRVIRIAQSEKESK